MADVRAFHALTYSARAGDLSSLVAPPYDVIPDQALAGYRELSPYNVVRLTRPGDDYPEAARRLREWLADGVLETDPQAAFHLYEQSLGGVIRRGLFGAVRLTPYEAGEVLPHERTHRGPKADRLALYRATATALEPLWFVYGGAGTPLPDLLADGFAQVPDRTFETSAEAHRLWRIADPDWTARASEAFAGIPLLIADGHHRYETALAYASEVGAPPPAAANYALVLLCDIDDPGLKVLPTHRVLRLSPVAVVGGEPAGSLADTLRGIRGQVAAGHYARGQFQVLPLEGELALVELHRQVIDNLLGRRTAEEGLIYTRDPEEAVRLVDADPGSQAFFLDAPDLAVVLKLAQAGNVLPQKSTYFHPKPPSGMLMLTLDRPEA
ncbi:MAG: hypothetical protein NVS9B1_09910 [Candidatus Dormibacteraceae bacterium]